MRKTECYRHRERASAEVNWAHERYRCIYSQRNGATDMIAWGAHIYVRVTWKDFPTHGCVSAICPCILLRSGIETEPSDEARHSPNCTYLRLVYIPKVPYTGIYSTKRRRGRTVVKCVNTWGRGVHVGPRSTLCTSLCVYRCVKAPLYSEEEEEEEVCKREKYERSTAKSKTEFVFGKARGDWLSAYLRLLITSLFRIFLTRVCAFSLYAYYIRERVFVHERCPFVHLYFKRRVPLSTSRSCANPAFYLLLLPRSFFNLLFFKHVFHENLQRCKSSFLKVQSIVLINY